MGAARSRTSKEDMSVFLFMMHDLAQEVAATAKPERFALDAPTMISIVSEIGTCSGISLSLHGYACVSARKGARLIHRERSTHADRSQFRHCFGEFSDGRATDGNQPLTGLARVIGLNCLPPE